MHNGAALDGSVECDASPQATRHHAEASLTRRSDTTGCEGTRAATTGFGPSHAGPSRDREHVLQMQGTRSSTSPTLPTLSLPRHQHPASAAHLAPPPTSLAYSPWDVRLSPVVDFSDKGKSRETDPSNPHDPADSLSPAATASPPAASSLEFSSDDEREPESSAPRLEHPVPIRIRRVGALGISVDSDSTKDGVTDRESDEPTGVLGSRKRRKRKSRNTHTRTADQHDVGVLDSESKGNNTFDDAGASEEIETAGGTRRRKRTKAVSETNFRSIVDDLTVENQALKNRLRRYEGAHLPPDMKRDRLFEVRYFEGLSSERRDELATFLTYYVRHISQQRGNEPLSAADLPLALTDAPKNPTSSPRLRALQAPQTTEVIKPDLPAPVIPERKLVRHRRKRDEREMLAGPSNSGVEPPSLTGTGSGLQLESTPDPERASKKSKVDHGSSAPPRDIIAKDDEPKAVELVAVVERLFEDSLKRQPDPQPTKRKTPGTNEAYLGALLQNDDLSGGWTYLNLVSTMAQLHRFNVTMPFVQAALRHFSHKIELSPDATKIRWRGPRPAPGGQKQQDMPPAEVIQDGDKRDRQTSRSSQSSGKSSSSSDAIFSEERTTSGQASTAATTDPPQSVAPPPDKILRGHRPATVIQRVAQPHQPSSLRHESKADMDAEAGPDDQAAVDTEANTTSSEEAKNQSEDSKKSDCQYVSFFNRWRKGHSTLRSSSSSSGNESADTLGLEGGAPTGKMIFYSNVDFCSDLSRDTPVVLSSQDLNLPFPPLGTPSALHKIFGEANKTLVPELLDFNVDMDHLVPSTLDDVQDLRLYTDEPSATFEPLTRVSSDSSMSGADSTDELERFRGSGLNGTQLCDLFTLIVTTSRPTKRPTLASPRKQQLLDFWRGNRLSLPLPLSQPSLDVRFAVLSTECINHEPLALPVRRPLLPHLNSSSSESGADDEGSSGSPTMAQAPRVPRPPSPDYLISLAMPFYTWSPRQQRPFSAAGAFWRPPFGRQTGGGQDDGDGVRNGRGDSDGLHSANGRLADHKIDHQGAACQGGYETGGAGTAASDSVQAPQRPAAALVPQRKARQPDIGSFQGDSASVSGTGSQQKRKIMATNVGDHGAVTLSESDLSPQTTPDEATGSSEDVKAGGGRETGDDSDEARIVKRRRTGAPDRGLRGDDSGTTTDSDLQPIDLDGSFIAM